MQLQKIFQSIVVLGALLVGIDLTLFCKQEQWPLQEKLIAQNTNTYLGPNQKLPGNPQRVRIQILVYNDPDPKGVTINNASFDGSPIPLKPRDIYGFRGQASFQKAPGKYKLRWEVQKDKQAWPRTISHEEEVTIDPRDLWIQITISGDTAEIS